MHKSAEVFTTDSVELIVYALNAESANCGYGVDVCYLELAADARVNPQGEVTSDIANRKGTERWNR